MELTTKIPIPKSNHPIDYNSRIISFGSCFTENMGEKLDYFKFQTTTNPFGILFHPLAIEKLISFALSEKQFTEEDIFFHMERWHCFDVHSELSHVNKEEFLKQLNSALLETKKALLEATHCIITLGTAWAYRHKVISEIVANCHKVPQKEFEKGLLSIEEMETSLENSIAILRKVNPNITFIFTISPVRHLKDGFVENQRSKANLIAALHGFILKSPTLEGWGAYFPSYEILMDELRDYRFYAEDMLHPSAVAINYIWQRFVETWVSKEVFSTMKEVENIQKDLRHRPFHKKSKAHLAFLFQLDEKIHHLQKKYKHIHFSETPSL
ncbi:MAG: GSCFA domain-containing protein [Bacteroidetes bacterium HGW-Bacteroidetes-2]|jgi:hypothetical protein|nr:MAG: GSCFA domain-containing protein [Bacteroidetes bacterium HGW-Bacteroidetes-2]